MDSRFTCGFWQEQLEAWSWWGQPMRSQCGPWDRARAGGPPARGQGRGSMGWGPQWWPALPWETTVPTREPKCPSRPERRSHLTWTRPSANSSSSTTSSGRSPAWVQATRGRWGLADLDRWAGADAGGLGHVGHGRGCVCVLSSFSCVQLVAAPWTVALWAPLTMGFLSNPGIEPTSHLSPALAGRFFTINATREAPIEGIREPLLWLWVSGTHVGVDGVLITQKGEQVSQKPGGGWDLGA